MKPADDSAAALLAADRRAEGLLSLRLLVVLIVVVGIGAWFAWGAA